MKLKATTLALVSAAALSGLVLTAPATSADGPSATTATTTTTTTPPTAPEPAGARDPISALSATSITVGPLTCALGAGSPAVTFKLGDRVRIACVNGVLTSIAADGDPPKPAATTTTTTTTTAPPPAPSVTASGDGILTRGGTLTSIGEHSLTVDSLTCALGATSPSIAGFKVGDRVGIACQSNALIKIVALSSDEHPAAPHDELQTRLGPIAVLGGGSITVDGLTCSVGAASPSVSGFKLGDRVGIGCANGALVKIGALQSDDGGFKVAIQLGEIVSIRGDGITVGSLSCKLADSSPSIASFHVGDRAGIGCAGGILFMIGALPATDAAPQIEVKHALIARFHGCIKRGAERCVVAGVLRRISHRK
jgi:hypothetical protein